MDSVTKTAIVKGTLGRRLQLEQYKLNKMLEQNEVGLLSYQYGIVIGLGIAKSIIEMSEHESS